MFCKMDNTQTPDIFKIAISGKYFNTVMVVNILIRKGCHRLGKKKSVREKKAVK